MKRVRLVVILMLAGVTITFLATLFPSGLTILLSLTIGNGLIVVAFGMYMGMVWGDLKRHRIL